MVLVPRVVDAVAPTPVVAAGGIADARGLVAALALGADGILMGTRFLATPEANTHPLYQRNLLAATEEEAVRTTLFGNGWPDAPHRTLRTAFVDAWLGKEALTQESGPDELVIGDTRLAGQTVPVSRFASLPPNRESTGDIEAMSLLAGQSVGLVHEIKPAAAIVRELIEGAQQIIEQRLNGTLTGDR
jgi:NAD(P)H-dependent flavin oxidoreductase YrpB (nitropropane dioxygenase family)